MVSGEKYGAVTLIASYKRSDNKLHVEVLNASNLIPLDSNGERTTSDKGRIWARIEPDGVIGKKKRKRE